VAPAMGKSTVFILMLLLNSVVFAQPVWDTATDFGRHESGAATYRPSLRIGLAYNQSEKLNPYYSAEIGINFTRIHLVWLLSNCSNRYISAGFAPKQQYINRAIYSVKAGYEVVFRYIAMGAELKTTTDLKNTAFYFMPKAGITYFGKIGMYYLYGLPLTNNHFSNQMNSQIKLQYNFAKKMVASFKQGQ
jgi:hypothetical protein